MARRRRKIRKKWMMRNGKEILIEDMSDRHILNAIKMFEKLDSRKQQVEWLKEEKDKRLDKINDEPVKNRWSILDFSKDESIGDET